MAYPNVNVRPAGYSDESSDDADYCGGFDDNSGLETCDGFTTSPVTKHAGNHLFMSTSSTSASTMSSASSGSSSFGRGRGLGYPNPPPPGASNGSPISWGGRGRSHAGGATTASINRHRRRSDSGSPTSVAGDKRKLKEALLKRVPDFGMVLQKESWAREVSKNLKSVWDADQKILKAENRKFAKELHNAFKVCGEEKGWNVPNLALCLVITSSDFLAPQGGKNQAQAVCNGLGQYLTSFSTATSTIPYLSISAQLQQVAFEAAIFQKKESLLKHILECFQLATSAACDSNLKSYLLDEIQQRIKRKEYTEACYCAAHLKLHSSFDIHDFLVPLILQDKPSVVEDFLEHSPDHQRQLIKFLDDKFEPGKGSILIQLSQYKIQHHVPFTKDEKFDHKPISKLIKRLRSKYNLGFECCPNIGHRQRFGELRHLFSRRYEKNEMSAASFAELVDELSRDSDLKEDIINYYMDYQDFLNAARFIISHELFTSPACQDSHILRYLPEPYKSEWEQKLGLRGVGEPSWELDEIRGTHGISDPEAIAELHGFTRTSETQQQRNTSWGEEELWKIRGTGVSNAIAMGSKKARFYYYHPLPRHKIYIHTEPHQILNLCGTLANALKNFGCPPVVPSVPPIVSGFDSEWKPILSQYSGAALLQLAFEDAIHLVDVVSLKNTLQREKHFEGSCVWKALRKDYFENPAILKLGFDLRNDVKMLTETVPEWKGLNMSWRGMLDLSSLKSGILKECPHLFCKQDAANPNTEGESGLSELVYLCTGNSLCKEEQMSDWEKRPLREPQVLYAASDAYCLISVFRSLEKLCAEKEVNLPRIMENYFKGQAKGPGGNSNGDATSSSSKRKRSSVELVLDLLRILDISCPTQSNQNKSSPGSVKLVVDTMLLGLGRYLRSLGFNTVMLENNQGHECTVYYVRKEDRRIITRGVQAGIRISGQLDQQGEEDMMYLVKSESTAAQLEEICNHFNVALAPTRLFTICFRCNTSTFIKVSVDFMFNLMEIAGCHLMKKPRGGEDLIESLNHFKNKSFDDMVLYVAAQDEELKEWKLLDEKVLIIEDDARNVLTPSGERVELTRLQMVSHLVDQIFVCNGCGKCYWSSKALEAYYKKNLTPIEEVAHYISA